MSKDISCFRCGASLDYLSPPLSRRDECRACRAPVHVCRMCVFFNVNVVRQCTEDDAEDVPDKEKVNFCEWFKPADDAFDPVRAEQVTRAKSELDSLFLSPDTAAGRARGSTAAGSTDSNAEPEIAAAEDLFK